MLLDGAHAGPRWKRLGDAVANGEPPTPWVDQGDRRCFEAEER